MRGSRSFGLRGAHREPRHRQFPRCRSTSSFLGCIVHEVGCRLSGCGQNMVKSLDAF